ncbi:MULTISPECIES: tyrosine-type recombinase/integrase [Bacillus]|uniref:tyrosine-type recombinase/integrase n=1 Tax=Bacillus TaxID=1386 RepID=UPI0003092E2C|nr:MULTISPECIES: tyrosine-type recombinase/integrase [Bacillus]
MNTVEPIRDTRHISAMKKALHGRDLLLFTYGINSGLRISDILTLKVGDIRNKDSIVVQETKTRKPKRFIFNDTIKKAVADLIPATASDDEYVFKSRKGNNKPISRVAAYQVLNAAAERAGIADKIGAIGTHTLRKTFGYHAYKKGVDIALLQSIFNHSAQSITLKYIGINQDSIDEVYANINL